MAKVQMQVVQVQVQVQVVKEELQLVEIFSKESNLLDLEQLFRSVEHVLLGATTFAENCLQGSNKTVKHSSGPALTNNLISPLGLLKQISCKVNRMILDDKVEEIINDRVVLAEKVLKGYKWPAGAVLSLAAFALDYGELWHYYNSPNDMVKAMAELRRLSFCTDPHHPWSKPLSDLNDLVRQTLHLVSFFYNFKNLRETIPDGMDSSDFEQFMSRYVEDDWCYVATQTVIACMVQFTYLLNRIEKKQDYLSNIKSNLHNVLTQLEVKYTAFKKQIETEKAYQDLIYIFDKPTGTMEVMKRFIYCGGRTDEYWICNGNGQKVRMEEELRDKKILLLISDLTIKKEQISVLYSQIYEQLNKNEYEMVWIPIEEEWKDDKKRTFESVRSEMKWCYWYTESYEPIPAIRYVREEWKYYSSSEPMVMFIDDNGSVKSKVEFHEIDTLGIKAFPLITTGHDHWDHVPPFLMKISSVKRWVEEERLFLLYGGKKCSKWTKELGACEKKDIRYYEVGSSEKESKELIGKFWIYMEKLFQASQQQQKESVWKEILRLVSCRDKSGWALLYKGSTILMGGHLKATSNALDTIQSQYPSNWELILGENKFDKKILVEQHPCLLLEPQGFSVWETESMECHCGERIEKVTMLRCCHGRTNHENGPC